MWPAVAEAPGPAVAPSPKSKAYVEIGVASPSVDPEAFAVTVSGAGPADGLTARAAAGGYSVTASS